jgi:N-acetyl-anhydromuramyl-L-alanine amidase AmpD
VKILESTTRVYNKSKQNKRKEETADLMDISKKLIKQNYSSRGGRKITYIVIHDTGNTRKGADAENHFQYFNGGYRGASAHYFVDEKQALQIVEDSNAAWHVGDGRGKYGITNSNSIGIEICVNSDGDYKKAVAKTIELTAYLMRKYGIPLDNVVRHYDASRKSCPMSMKANNWAAWTQFKRDLQIAVTPKTPSGNKVKLNVLGRMQLVDGYLKDGTNYIKVDTFRGVQYIPIRELAAALGLVVGWDQASRTVMLK